FTLDCERRELRADGAQVAIEPQVFDLLVYLIENRDRVVSKDDLIASVWGGRVVSDSTVDSRINAVRKAVGDSGKEQNLNRTWARKGNSLVGEGQEKGRAKGTEDRNGAETKGVDSLPPLISDRPQSRFCDSKICRRTAHSN